MARVTRETVPRAATASRFRVKIYYREPRYAASRGMSEREYSGAFEVHAAGMQEAIASAIAEFEDIARLSSVGWARKITRITCSDGRETREVSLPDFERDVEEAPSQPDHDRPTEPRTSFWRTLTDVPDVSAK